MTTALPVSSGAPISPDRPARGARFWPAFVCGLLSINVIIVGVTVYFAVTDRSAGIEPDYYRRAAAYEDTLRQNAANQRLAWSAAVHVDGANQRVLVTLKDRDGRAIDGASVKAEVFASLRSADRQALLLTTTGEGQYAGAARVTVGGRWRVRLTVQVGRDTWTHEAQIMVDDARPKPAGGGA